MRRKGAVAEERSLPARERALPARGRAPCEVVAAEALTAKVGYHPPGEVRRRPGGRRG